MYFHRFRGHGTSPGPAHAWMVKLRKELRCAWMDPHLSKLLHDAETLGRRGDRKDVRSFVKDVYAAVVGGVVLPEAGARPGGPGWLLKRHLMDHHPLALGSARRTVYDTATDLRTDRPSASSVGTP